MGLTVTEKEHFKDQLTSRVDQLISNIKGENATWERDLLSKATTLTEDRFVVVKLMHTLSELKSRRDNLNNLIEETKNALVLRIVGQQADDAPSDEYGRCSAGEHYQRYPRAVRPAMRAQVDYELSKLKEAHPIGQRIIWLQEMRRDYMDKLNMAGSHKQLQEVWAGVLAHLVEVEPGQRNSRNVRIRDADGQKETR